MNDKDIEKFKNLCKADVLNLEDLRELLSVEDFLDSDMGDDATPLQFVLKNIKDRSNSILVSIAKELIKAGANPHKSYSSNIKSPIELAIERNQAELIELMFEYGADPKIRLLNQDTLLHSTIPIDLIEPEIVKILLKNGVDPEGKNENISSVDMATTLAEVNDNMPIYRLKADMITNFIANRNKAREEFIRICAAKEFDEKAFLELLKDPDFLVYDIVGGYSPLQYSIACAYTQDENLSLANPSTAIEVSKYLINAGADLSRNRTKKYEYSPVALAVRANQPELLKLMLDRGFTANFKSENGNSLLHTAVNHAGDLEIFRHLLDHGADPEIKNNLGESPLVNATDEEIELMNQYLKLNVVEFSTESVEEDKSSSEKLGPIMEVLVAMVDKNQKTAMTLKLNTNPRSFKTELKNEMKWTGLKSNQVKAKDLHGISNVINAMHDKNDKEYSCDIKSFSPEVQKALFNIIAYAGKLSLEPKSRFNRKNKITEAKYNVTMNFLKDLFSGSEEDIKNKVEEYMKKPEIIINRGSGLYRIHGVFAKKGLKVRSTMQELFLDLNRVLEVEKTEKSKKEFK